MKRLIASIAKALQSFSVKQLFATALAVCLMTAGMTVGLASGAQAASNSDSDQPALGQSIRQRIAETDRSDRPKTTGEFLDEARGDVPAGERAKNITRDSVEAFKELGKEYTPDVKAGARNLRDNAAAATQRLGRD